jgi:hypothetical protein
MQIPNVDGNYKTKDGSIIVTVTRSIISIDVVKPKEKEYTIIDEDDHSSTSHKVGGRDIKKTLRIVGDGLDGISDALIGRGH